MSKKIATNSKMCFTFDFSSFITNKMNFNSKKQILFMSFEAFFNPRSIAIVGASHEEGKIGYVVFTNFLSGLFKGKVYPVNKNTEPILGQKVYDSILSIPGDVDLVVIVIPGKFVQEVLSDCVKKGVKSVVIISSGFSEMGESGKKLEDELKKTVRATKTRVIGTNCLGVYDSSSQVDTLFLSRK